MIVAPPPASTVRGTTSAPPEASWDATRDRAARLCDHTGVPLTPLRVAVLGELWEASDRAAGAYDIASRLILREGRSVAPNSVYRSITSLTALGLVRRIECRNSYILTTGDSRGEEIFLLCDHCDVVGIVTATEVEESVRRRLRTTGFEPLRRAIENVGRYAGCLVSGTQAFPAALQRGRNCVSRRAAWAIVALPCLVKFALAKPVKASYEILYHC